MADKKKSSIKKEINKSFKKMIINKSRLSRIKTFIKKIENLDDNKYSREEIKLDFSHAEREIMRGASNGLFHKNTAARKVSRLARKVNTFFLKTSYSSDDSKS